MNKFYQKLFRNTFSTILTVAVASLAVVGFVYAATTIGTDIVTTGASRLATINATTTKIDTLTVNTGATFNGESVFTANGRFNLINATSSLIDGLNVNAATTTDSFKVGGRATTTGNTVLGAKTLAVDATTTITFGDNAKTNKTGTCLKFYSAGLTIWCQFDTTRLGATATSTALICQTSPFSTSCE